MTALKYIAFISTIFWTFTSFGQDKIMSFNAGATYHAGYIIAHRNDVAVLVKDYTRAVELSFSKRFNGEKDWEYKYARPYFGGSLMYFDFGNPEQLGKGFSLFGFYNFPLTQGENFELNFKLGFGPGYVEKVFDKDENYKNFAVSTHFNGFAYGNLNARYTFADHYALNLGISISHFSNAAAKKPNLGMNIPALNLGMVYRFHEVEKIERDVNFKAEVNKDWIHEVIVSGGRTSKSILGENYPTFSAVYDVSRHVSIKSRFALGADIFCNTALVDENNPKGDEIENNMDATQIGTHFGYYLQVDKLAIFINQGVYLRSKYKEDGFLYNRFGFRYLAWEGVIFNISMKTHFAVADHVELGLGYRF